MYVYYTDYILNNMVFLSKSLLDILMKIFIMLRHQVAEISRFKFDDHRVIRTGTSDLKLFWVVYAQNYTRRCRKFQASPDRDIVIWQ